MSSEKNMFRRIATKRESRNQQHTIFDNLWLESIVQIVFIKPLELPLVHDLDNVRVQHVMQRGTNRDKGLTG